MLNLTAVISPQAMRINTCIGAFCLLLLAGCAAQQGTGTSTTDDNYYENLSALRPKVELPADTDKNPSGNPVKQPAKVITPAKGVNSKVDAVLDSIDRYNLTRKFVDGYTIQIYSGQSREDAMNAKKKINEEWPEYSAMLQYQQPKFKVIVGRYYTKLEAQPDFYRIRQSFPSAIFAPEKIQISN